MYTADNINAFAEISANAGITATEATEAFQAVQSIAELCKPCAIKLAADGAAVKSTGGRTKKITCAECGRRRFGVAYQFKKEGARK